MKIPSALITVVAASGLILSFDSPPAETPATTGAAAFMVDQAHSSVTFSSQHLGVSEAYGRFNEFSGEVSFDAGKPGESSILLSIKASSVDTNNDQRDGHLKSPDFFSVKEYPEIRFESTKVTGTAEELEVMGELSFHGVTKEVSASARLVGERETSRGYKAGFLATFTIDMQDFGIEFVKQNPGAVGPEVEVTVSLECNRK